MGGEFRVDIRGIVEGITLRRTTANHSLATAIATAMNIINCD